MEERLAALGYVAGHINPKRLDQPAGGDPKDKIALYNLLKQAASLSIEGKLEDAAVAVKAALSEDPDIVEAHTWFNLAASRWKDEAKRVQAARMRDELENTMTPDQRAAAYRRATEWQDSHSWPRQSAASKSK